MQGNLKFTTILHYLQDAAEQDATRLGVGLAELSARGMIWVLARIHVRLKRYPMLGDTVHVHSWPVGWQRLYALRDFLLTGANGTPFAVASSAWLVLRAADLRPLRPKDHLPDIPLHNQRSCPLDLKPMSEPADVAHASSFDVRMHDLDINRHVNNAIYAEWALESVPHDLWQHHRPFELEAQFLGMALPGQRVRSEVAIPLPMPDGAIHCVHRILRADDAQTLTRLQSRWRTFAP
jgi:acyl-ACP thioesterase